jgi:hypothetical protein
MVDYKGIIQAKIDTLSEELSTLNSRDAADCSDTLRRGSLFSKISILTSVCIDFIEAEDEELKKMFNAQRV